MAAGLDMDHLEREREIFDRLNEFTVVNCGMVHERVKMENKRPMIHQTENGYECTRLRLCPQKVRDFRLGCAHASSNFRFQNYLSELSEWNEEFRSFETKLSSLLTAVYTLDHQKGELEKKLAIYISEDKNTADIKNQIQQAVSRHNALMEQLKELKQSILNLLEIKIGD